MNTYYSTHACELIKFILSTDFITSQRDPRHVADIIDGAKIYLMFDSLREIDGGDALTPLLNVSRVPMHRDEIDTGMVSLCDFYIIPESFTKGSEKDVELNRLIGKIEDDSVLYQPDSPEVSLVCNVMRALRL